MKLFWKFYAFLFYFIVLNNAFQLLNKDSQLVVYYNTTIVFSHWFLLPYLLNILNTFINFIICLFVFGYAFDIKNISNAPQWLFYFRLLTDSTGHIFEIKGIESGFAQSKLLGFISLSALILPILPSYILQWRITFKK